MRVSSAQLFCFVHLLILLPCLTCWEGEVAVSESPGVFNRKAEETMRWSHRVYTPSDCERVDWETCTQADVCSFLPGMDLVEERSSDEWRQGFLSRSPSPEMIAIGSVRKRRVKKASRSPPRPVGRMCRHPFGCSKRASFGEQSSRLPLFCLEHKLLGHINVNSR
eukprot:752524-Hanusia_phi.AAC.7